MTRGAMKGVLIKVTHFIKKHAYNCFAGGTRPYRDARSWWLDNRKCTEQELINYLVTEFSYLAGSAEKTDRAHTVALFLSKSEPYQSVSVATISLFVSMFSLILSVLSPQIEANPKTIVPIACITGVFVVVFIVIWVCLREITNCCLAGDNEFRGRLSAL